MPRSQKYDKLVLKMYGSQPIYATYRGEDEDDKRMLCPHVVGYKKEGDGEVEANECVLCYQLEPEEGWRCFFISELEVLDDEPDQELWHTPEDWANNKHQNSVQKPKHKFPT